MTTCTLPSTTTPGWPMWELLADERDQSCAGFWRRAQGFFAAHGITVRRVLTDNGPGYRSHAFAAALAEHQVIHKWTRPYRPQANGNVERFNRTLLEECAYRRLYRSQAARTRALPAWVHRYNHHRAHTALGANHLLAASTTSRLSTPRRAQPAPVRSTRGRPARCGTAAPGGAAGCRGSRPGGHPPRAGSWPRRPVASWSPAGR
jgi:transposase InsO family protein